MQATFTLDPRLERTTRPVRERDGIALRLADDSRWPWVMLVPCAPGIREVTDLRDDRLTALVLQARDVACTLRRMEPGCRTNVATLGNVVEQFHLHVVARREGDPNWPGPIWGFGEPVPYENPQAWIDRFLEHERGAPS